MPDANTHLRHLIRLSQKILDLTHQETQALVKNDHMQFAFLMQDKEKVADSYREASEYFRAQIEEFRNADQSLLIKLDRMQTEIKDVTQSNNTMIDSLQKRARANTQSTLFSAQDLGQRMRTDNKTSTGEQQHA